MSARTFGIKRLCGQWDRFFHEKADLSICGEIRIAYAFLLLVNALVLLPDLEKWFGESGVMPLSASRTIVDPDTVTLFQWLPQTNAVLWTCYTLFLVQIVALLLGVFTRVQLVCVFVWLVSFQHRHLILFDGEDVVFRLLCFFLIFTPAGEYYSLDRWRKNRSGRGDDEAAGTPVWPIWPLRLMQIQMSLIYISTVWEKLKGKEWLDGTALYYVSRLDDLFGRFWVPDFMFESMVVINLMTWSVLAVEMSVPLALWFKKTRRTALVVAFAFHLATDYAMNLFLFQWIMMVGLLSFVGTGHRWWLPWRPRPAEEQRDHGDADQSDVIRSEAVVGAP